MALVIQRGNRGKEMKHLILALVASSCCACAAMNPMHVASIREQCRQEVQSANMPAAHETNRQRANRMSGMQTKFQQCLRKRL